MLRKVMVAVMMAMSMFIGMVQASVTDDFESGSLSTDWVDTDAALVKSETGNYYARVYSGAASSSSSAEAKKSLGGYLGASSSETFAAFSISFDFRFVDTGQRQMNLVIGGANEADSTVANPAINLIYDGSTDSFAVYGYVGGVGGWQTLAGLPTSLADNTWHSVTIRGYGFNSGSSDRAYDITVNGTTQTGIQFFQYGDDLGVMAGFNFNSAWGSNPGFDVDNVVAIPATNLLLNSDFESTPWGTGWNFDSGTTSNAGLNGSATAARLPYNTSAELSQSVATPLTTSFTFHTLFKVAGTTASTGLKLQLETSDGPAIEINTVKDGYLQLVTEEGPVEILKSSDQSKFVVPINQYIHLQVTGRNFGSADAEYDVAWSEPNKITLSHAVTGITNFYNADNARTAGIVGVRFYQLQSTDTHSYWVDDVTLAAGLDPVPASDYGVPTSSGVDLRAYQSADGVVVEFVAYDVEAAGTIMLALVDEDDNVLWSGSVEVVEGPQVFARFLVPGLEPGQSYRFKVRDEVGKWWDADGVTVGSFDSRMSSASLTGLTLTFASQPGATYDVQWTAELGGEWQTVVTVTASAEETSVVAGYPEGGEAAGFFRVQAD